MRVSFEWIKEFVDLTASPQEVADRLTMAGLEIEGMEQSGEDIIMEVNVTPNRPDCLNILGVAREAASAFGLPLKLSDHNIASEYGPSEIAVEIKDSDLCARYSGRHIKGVRVCESPEWMKDRLEKCGIRSINNIVDITNYVLLEYGHPLHAFDADKLSGMRVKVAKAGPDSRILTLDGVEREVPADTLLIWDAEGPVAVAGIMGGEGSAVTETTVNVFLESAWFSPESVRKSSKLLGLRSESSYRFERGADRVFLETALDRAALLIAELGGGRVSGIVDVYPAKYRPVEIRVSYSRVSRLIGIEIGKDEIFRLLNNIGISTDDRGDDFIAVPPSFRGDISEPVDIIEEIARCYGYGRIPARPPRAALTDASIDSRAKSLRMVKDSIRRSGFDEVVNFSFMNSADLDLLSLAEGEDEHRRRHLMLRNPLRQEECLLRTTLVPALVRNFLYNVARGIVDIKIFEISRIFIHQGAQLPEEGLKLAGLYFCDNPGTIWKEQSPPFYMVKGAIEAIFAEMRLQGISYLPSGEVFFHPGKSADIFCSDKKIGYMGELGPKTIEKLDLKITKPRIVVFEIDLGMLISLHREKLTYSHIPRYPSVERDIALIINDQVTTEELLSAFKDFNSELIENSALFDYYKGKNIPEGKKSIGVRVTYRGKDRTLTDSEVEPVHAKLLAFVSEKTGAALRGTA